MRGRRNFTHLRFAFAFGLLVSGLVIGVDAASAQYVVSEIIDASGDGAGHGLDTSGGIAMDSAGNVYVAGFVSKNVFKITPAGVITQIIDATGDG